MDCLSSQSTWAVSAQFLVSGLTGESSDAVHVSKTPGVEALNKWLHTNEKSSSKT